eukprot:GHUV01019116.1.p1 GENE.GHUV01019116.1~~GHUV01019116.1.p1  ORF type:complete len:324 (+),score=74.13 GHUV01019116.1:1555-2526(+)
MTTSDADKKIYSQTSRHSFPHLLQLATVTLPTSFPALPLYACHTLAAVHGANECVLNPAGAIAAVWFMIPNQYNLKQVLPTVTAFVDTARAGDLPAYIQKDYPWLQTPAQLANETMTGGYYVGSDYVKYSMPIATTMTMMAWSMLEFPKGFAAAGVDSITKDQLKWGADYLMKAHTTPTSFVVQVGNPVDYLLNIAQRNGSWGPPQEMPANRTVYTITRTSKGGADVVAAAASALAATYEVYKASDTTYATSALNHAQQLYALATNLPSNATYCAEVACFEGLKSGGYRWKAYLSESVYDDLALAAAWLYKATGRWLWIGESV